ncbi:hypothetical protein ARMGADRAFT_1089073 [Armillaria gallica]|uniref:Uncharacterized protein n=1 Tax=Armillaria gallica TaxID=47427 RepID=A0A2H3CL65_ARMGA|nr:hypothetical protein ARMGADRAFT_1089073 [Armillaria gallica]
MQFNILQPLRAISTSRRFSQSVDIRTRTNTSMGSGTPGGGKPQKPSGAGNGGQTNSSAGATRRGGRAT